MFTPKKYESTGGIEGLSGKQLSEHYKLYEGYIKKANEIREKMAAVDKSLANATYSEVGELKRQESFALNGIKLHEAYFGVMGGDGKPSGLIEEEIIRDFGSFEAWKEDVVAAGLSARGWVVLAHDTDAAPYSRSMSMSMRILWITGLIGKTISKRFSITSTGRR